MRRKAVFVSLLLPSLSATAAISDPQCDQASTVAVAHLRLARESRNAMNRSAFNEKCRVVFTQFVEAVAARKPSQLVRTARAAKALSRLSTPRFR